MKLIVGLGNIGKEYINTRHNIGFIMVDSLAMKKGIEFKNRKFNGSYAEYYQNGEKIILLKPEKYMNLSGEVVSSFVQFYKIPISDILIISDDLDMPVGKIKIKYKGSSGGHNGLKNIISHLGTDEFKRIKIGIANNKLVDTKDYVLGKFTKEEFDTIKNISNQFPNMIDDYLNNSFDVFMSKYNKK